MQILFQEVDYSYQGMKPQQSGVNRLVNKSFC